MNPCLTPWQLGSRQLSRILAFVGGSREALGRFPAPAALRAAGAALHKVERASRPTGPRFARTAALRTPSFKAHTALRAVLWVGALFGFNSVSSLQIFDASLTKQAMQLVHRVFVKWRLGVAATCYVRNAL